MFKKINLTSALIIAISAFVGLGVGVYSQSNQTKESLNAPTLINKTQPLTEQQKEHVKLHGEKNLGERTIEETVKLAKQRNEKGLRLSVIREKFNSGELPDQATTPAQVLTKKADAIVIGTISKRDSQITADNTFLFSDYIVRLENVIKPGSEKLLLGNNIVITSLSGNILIDGIEISASDAAFPILEVGKKYLFFLSKVKTTKAYQPIDESSTILITADITNPVSSDSEIEKGERLEKLIGEIYSALAGEGGKSNEP